MAFRSPVRQDSPALKAQRSHEPVKGSDVKVLTISPAPVLSRLGQYAVTARALGRGGYRVFSRNDVGTSAARNWRQGVAAVRRRRMKVSTAAARSSRAAGEPANVPEAPAP